MSLYDDENDKIRTSFERIQVMIDGAAKTEPVDMTSAAYWKAQYQELERNVRMWGVIEIMVRNPQVSEYIGHLERRVEKAETLLASTANYLRPHQTPPA